MRPSSSIRADDASTRGVFRPRLPTRCTLDIQVLRGRALVIVHRWAPVQPAQPGSMRRQVAAASSPASSLGERDEDEGVALLAHGRPCPRCITAHSVPAARRLARCHRPLSPGPGPQSSVAHSFVPRDGGPAPSPEPRRGARGAWLRAPVSQRGDGRIGRSRDVRRRPLLTAPRREARPATRASSLESGHSLEVLEVDVGRTLVAWVVRDDLALPRSLEAQGLEHAPRAGVGLTDRQRQRRDRGVPRKDL
jgi:hypothetical protein